MRAARFFLALLFLMFAGTMVQAAGGSELLLSGRVTAINGEGRRLLVSAVDPGQAPRPVAVRLAWDTGQGSFADLLPARLKVGSNIVLRGSYQPEGIFLAKKVGGCLKAFSGDRSGVRARLNRAEGNCFGQ